VETKVKRTIQLNVLQFEHSEFLELTVVPAAEGAP